MQVAKWGNSLAIRIPAAVVEALELKAGDEIDHVGGAVMAALAMASAPLDAGAIAATFKPGRKIAPKVAAVLAALARLGYVASADGGATFMLRRAA